MEKDNKPVDSTTVEFRAIKKIRSALATLTPDQRRRVWAYVSDADIPRSVTPYQLQSE